MRIAELRSNVTSASIDMNEISKCTHTRTLLLVHAYKHAKIIQNTQVKERCSTKNQLSLLARAFVTDKV